MQSHTDRLTRLITAREGSCCDGTAADRLDRLRSFRDSEPIDTTDDLRALKTLGDGTRHTIVRLLASADRDLCVCEIEPVVDVSASAVSHALSDLYDAELVTRRQSGNWRFYAPTDRAEALLDALDATREGER